MTHAVLGRWGKSLALRLPQEIASKLDLREGDIVEVDASADSIVIQRTKRAHTLEELFTGRSPEEWRSLYAGAYEWGPDVGREIVEE
jgi:antitoxin MazE